jgi:ubiquinone/menaquinone biosynthesis C-methylase UbiE
MLAQFQAVNAAFSKQSDHYDVDDERNIILKDMRSQVYRHVNRFIKPESEILELNAGTGIDALKFVSLGHRVFATDLSNGMIAQIKHKIEKYNLHPRLKCQQLSYEQIDHLAGEKFDFVFSNFGGLNCIKDLSVVSRHLPLLLKPGAIVTWVIMPRIYLWEIASLLKGHGKKAFRRMNKHGVKSHLEGEFFTTYYHSLSDIRKAFGKQFKLMAVEGLAAVSPPPHRIDLPTNSPWIYKWLRKTDKIVRTSFPFNRWADHIIVTFQYNNR